MAVFLAAALRGVDGFVDGEDDVGHRYLRHILGERIAAARTAMLSMSARRRNLKQLLQIGKRNLLALADLRKRHRVSARLHPKIDHRRYRKTPFGCQSIAVLSLIINELWASAVNSRII